jgi:hypothetical protein
VRTDGDLLAFEKDGIRLYTVHFEDEGDCGDSYTFTPAGDCRTLPAEGPAVCGTENGFFTLRRTYVLQRADGAVRLDAAVTLAPGSDRPDFDIAIDNAAADHRLRMVITSPMRCDSCFGDTAFDLPRRPVLPESADVMHVRTRAMRNAAGITGEDTLVAFSAGARECETAAVAEGTRMALTLLRSVGHTYCTDLANRDERGSGCGTRWWTEDSKMTGRYTTRCGIALYPGIPDDVTVQNDALAWQLPPSVFGTWAHGSAAPAASFLAVENAVFSTAESLENGVAARVFAAREGGEARLTFAAPVRTARSVDLRGETLETALSIDGCTVTLPLTGGQIATVAVTF